MGIVELILMDLISYYWSAKLAPQRKKKSLYQAGAEAFDPYEPQRHKRGRKSHLAAAINKNIHDHPGMGWIWAIVFVVLFFGVVLLAVLKK